MSKAMLALYYRLPYVLKTWAAAGHGFMLQSGRYGPETEHLVAEAIERESWTAEQWQSYQQEQLFILLHRAATQVPFYRQWWNERRRRGDPASYEVLDHWPILEKESLRTNPRAFLADDINPRWMLRMDTSGTTGKPITLWWSRTTARRWYALFEARWRRWHGVTLKSRWAILGGKLVIPVSENHPPFWVWNPAMRQLYMSAYHLGPSFLPHYFDALKHYRIEYLWGYSSALHTLAQAVLQSGRRDLSMKVVLSNAEPLLDHQRQMIAEAFQCPVRETYGMAEIVAGAGECSKGHQHFWPEVGIVEIAQNDCLMKDDSVGDLIYTGLINADMPLIRYRVGDRGQEPVYSGECTCGRRLPIFPRVEGRCDDMVMLPDGRKIGRLDPVFKGGLPVREAQIIQEQLNLIRVKVVPDQGYGEYDAEDIRQRILQRLGDQVTVQIETTEAIPRTASGKFQAVISLVSRMNNGA